MGPVNRRSTPLVLIAFRIRMRGISLGRGCRVCLHADNALRGEDTSHLVTRRSPLGRWCLECDDASGQHLPLDSTPGGKTRQTSGGRWTTGTRDSVGKRPATIVTNRTYNRQVGGATMLIMTVQNRSARAGLPLISCSVTGTNLPSHRWRERHTLYPRLLDMP